MFGWLITRLFKRKQPAPPPTLCVIDDDCMVHSMIAKYFPGYVITDLYQLPDTLQGVEVLKKYDVLIVDGQGIGSKLCYDGQKFLSTIYTRPVNQKVVFFSGLSPDMWFEAKLKEKGMCWWTKGRNPEGLVQVVENYPIVAENNRRTPKPPEAFAKTLEERAPKMKRKKKRRHGRRGFAMIELLVVVGVICILMTLLVKGCNRQIVDIDWNFKRAVIRDGFGGYSGVVNIKSWRDYDRSDTVQITTDKGQVILTHSTNILLLKGNK